MREQRRRSGQRASTRREFLHECAICTGAMALPASWARRLAAAEGHTHESPLSLTSARPVAFKFFLPQQAAAVEAITEQIIPADEDPGAKWAGVVHYIDWGLASDLEDCRATYEAGLRRLEALARAVAGRPFAELDFATQTEVLEKLERDDFVDGSAARGREFFSLIRRHTLEGFFGDPKYGGNRDGAGWKMLKFVD